MCKNYMVRCIEEATEVSSNYCLILIWGMGYIASWKRELVIIVHFRASAIIVERVQEAPGFPRGSVVTVAHNCLTCPGFETRSCIHRRKNTLRCVQGRNINILLADSVIHYCYWYPDTTYIIGIFEPDTWFSWWKRTKKLTSIFLKIIPESRIWKVKATREPFREYQGDHRTTHTRNPVGMSGYVALFVSTSFCDELNNNRKDKHKLHVFVNLLVDIKTFSHLYEGCF